jgi:hypothetical protein
VAEPKMKTNLAMGTCHTEEVWRAPAPRMPVCASRSPVSSLRVVTTANVGLATATACRAKFGQNPNDEYKPIGNGVNRTPAQRASATRSK